jgi:hypothetical protein
MPRAFRQAHVMYAACHVAVAATWLDVSACDGIKIQRVHTVRSYRKFVELLLRVQANGRHVLCGLRLRLHHVVLQQHMRPNQHAASNANLGQPIVHLA